jgi:hypothetical protein
MLRKLALLVGLSLAGTTLAAPPLPLDLIPQDACIGLSIRDLADLQAKSDKLLKDHPNIPRLSNLFAEAYKELRLGWPVDERRSAAIICASGTLAGYAADADPNQSFRIGTVLPYKDLAGVAKAWSVKADDLEKGPVQVSGRNFDPKFALDYASARDGVAYISGSDKAVTAWMKATTLRQALPGERVKRLDMADGMVYLGPPLVRIGMEKFDTNWTPEELTEREKAAYRRVNRAAVEGRDLLLAFRLDEGLGVDLTAGFDPKGKESQALLKTFAAPGRTSSLIGLPEGPPLLGALGFIGVDDNSFEVGSLLAAELWFMRHTPGFLESDTANLRRILGYLYSRLKTGRLALYAGKEKQLAAIAVLEPRNADTFLKDLATMAQVSDEKAFDPNVDTNKVAIAKLVADLGSDDFDVREAASTKLGLIGAPALEALKVAEKSTDAEVRRRASELRVQIEKIAELRKKELAGQLFKQAFHPIFGWKAEAEERLRFKVHHLLMRFEAEDAPYTALLKEAFGPDWNRIRLAVVGGKVVAMLGSNPELFEEALKNVRDDKPGLDASAALAGFRKHVGPGRRAELHLALSLLRGLAPPAGQLPKDLKPDLSSVALRTGTADISLDFWMPPENIGDGLFWLR